MYHADDTFLHGLLGGILIGLASLLALVATGKIPGISGLFSRLLSPHAGRAAWRLMFFLGLLVGAGAAFAWLEPAMVYRPGRPLPAFAIAGLLVGLGTRVGGGCTSGHAVCGIGLGSRNALLATVLFMAAGMATVLALRHLPVGGLLQ